MDFYTKLFAGTIVFLIITLAVMGYFMSLSRKNQTYPPITADCPDYYSLDASGACNKSSNIFAFDASCNKQNFDTQKYKEQGTNYTSGLCAKKLWANRCEVNWDGITNNDNICYT